MAVATEVVGAGGIEGDEYEVPALKVGGGKLALKAGQ